ncbi:MULTISPECIES: hypothetical protein, partial [Helicobacter]
WKHNKNLTISGYYAYLMTDKPDYLRAAFDPTGGLNQPQQTDIRNSGAHDDETRQRVRVEVKYSF